MKINRLVRTHIAVAALVLFTAGAMLSGCKQKHDNPILGDYFARMYYINPAIVNDPANTNYVIEAGAAQVNAGKKKLVLVHGWDPTDTAVTAIMELSLLKERITTANWSSFFGTSDYNDIVGSGFDVYAFDYLSSESISSNGKRFRAFMDSLFAAESQNIILYGHSMGGLICRTAIYEGAQAPAYVKRVITTGAPFHGSPWASDQFEDHTGTLGDLAELLTNTPGGGDLAWDNYDNSILGASNSFLTTLNAKTDRDALFFAYYGSIPASGSYGPPNNDPFPFTTFCTVMYGANPKFAPSDGIVPSYSATLSDDLNGGVGTRLDKEDLGAYDHYQLKMVIPAIRQKFVTKIKAELP